MGIKKIFSLTVFSLLAGLLSAQSAYFNFGSPYDLSLNRDLITGGVSLYTYSVGNMIVRNERINSFTPGSFTVNDINEINFLDRVVAERWDLNAMDAGKIFRSASNIGSSAVLALMPGDLKSRGSLCLIYIQGYLLMQGLTWLAKGTTNRYRPFTYLTTDEINNLDDYSRSKFMEAAEGDDIEDSFFSGDASQTAYNYIFIAKVFSDYFPESKLKYGIWGAGITGTVLQAYFRSRSGKHFPTDVIMGSLVGGSIGYLMPHFHRTFRNDRFALNPGTYGLSLTYRF